MTTTTKDRADIEWWVNAAEDFLLDVLDDAAYDEAIVHVDGLRALLCRAAGGHEMVLDQCGRPEHAACRTCGEPGVAAG